MAGGNDSHLNAVAIHSKMEIKIKAIDYCRLEYILHSWMLHCTVCTCDKVVLNMRNPHPLQQHAFW